MCKVNFMDLEPGKNYRVEYKTNNVERIFIRICILSSRIKMCEIQIERFLQAKKSDNIKMQYVDMHFLLVSITNLLRMLKSLRMLLKHDKDFIILYKKYLSKLERLDPIRDHAEHIEDGRLEGTVRENGRKLSDPDTLGKIEGFAYNFGGDTFNIIDFQKDLHLFKVDFQKWEQWWRGSNILNISLKTDR